MSRLITRLASRHLHQPSPLTRPILTRIPQTAITLPQHVTRKAHIGEGLESLLDGLNLSGSSFKLDGTPKPHIKDPFAGEPYHLHCYSTRHNTHVALTAPSRDTIIKATCGTLGYRKAQRGTYEAAFQTVAHVMRKMQEQGLLEERVEKGIYRIEIVLSGFGDGRAAFLQALQGVEGSLIRKRVCKVTDSTKVKFGGCRGGRQRRLG